MVPTTLAEVVLLAVVVWLIYRLLAPLRRPLERLILRLLDPSKSDIIDAEIVPPNKKKREE
jgi:hypothetical protein